VNTTEKLNILLVVPRLNIGGAESYVITTALGLKAEGYQVTVASWGGQLTRKLRAAGISHYLVPIRFNPTLAAQMLTRIIKRCNIDIVHANSAAAGIAALKACRKLGKILVYTAHGVFGHNLQEKSLEQADMIICVSDFLKQRSIAMGIAPHKLTTVYSGIDVTQFNPSAVIKEKVRQEFGIGKDDFVVGIVARIKNLRDKGHQDLLELLKHYPAQTSNRKLLVIGKGQGLAALQSAVRKLGLTNQVILAGHRVDIPIVMQALDCLVLPSVFETFGLVLIEAMALSIPVIAYAVGGTPEAIEDGVTGFLVPKGDIGAMNDKLNLLSADQALRYRMGVNGRARVLAYFNSKQMLERLLAIYHQLYKEKVNYD